MSDTRKVRLGAYPQSRAPTSAPLRQAPSRAMTFKDIEIQNTLAFWLSKCWNNKLYSRRLHVVVEPNLSLSLCCFPSISTTILRHHHKPVALPGNIRLGWKKLTMSITPFYNTVEKFNSTVLRTIIYHLLEWTVACTIKYDDCKWRLCSRQ